MDDLTLTYKQGSGPTGAADQNHARQDTQHKHGGAWVLGHLINDDLGAWVFRKTCFQSPTKPIWSTIMR